MFDTFQSTFNDYDSMLNWFKTNVSFDFYKEGSADSQWAFFRELGLDVTRSDYRDIRRNILGLEFHQKDILSLSDDEVIPDDYLYSRHGLQISGEYLYRFDVTLFDNNSGQTITGTRALIGHDIGTVGEIKGELVDKLESAGAASDIIVLDIRLKGALIRQG
jgi:hypothetical protein